MTKIACGSCGGNMDVKEGDRIATCPCCGIQWKINYNEDSSMIVSMISIKLESIEKKIDNLQGNGQRMVYYPGGRRMSEQNLETGMAGMKAGFGCIGIVFLMALGWVLFYWIFLGGK